MQYPQKVKKGLVSFLAELPVAKQSDDWNAIQVAIALILCPSQFKKGTHVFLHSRSNAREEGCYDIREMSIKIYQHKLVVRRTHNECNSLCDIDRNYRVRYEYPSDKYTERQYLEAFSDTNDLFCEAYVLDDTDAQGRCYCNSNFSIETNVKI